MGINSFGNGTRTAVWNEQSLIFEGPMYALIEERQEGWVTTQEFPKMSGMIDILPD